MDATTLSKLETHLTAADVEDKPFCIVPREALRELLSTHKGYAAYLEEEEEAPKGVLVDAPRSPWVP